MSDKINNGGPAFPLNDTNLINICLNNSGEPMGMSLRDYFAAKVIQGVYSGRKVGFSTIDINEVSKLSYQVADAMLEAREK